MKRLFMAWLAAASILLGQPAKAAALIPIRYADLSIQSDNLYQYLALEQGIYAKHGIDLKLISFLKGGPEVIAAAASDQIDIGSIGTPILTAISRGIPIRIIGAPAAKGQVFILVARPEIKTLADLKAKTVGVSSVGGGQSQALRFILGANKIDPHLVPSIAYGAPASGYIALQSGKLAAVVMSEPLVSKAEIEGTGHILAKAVDYYGRYEHSYVFATTDFIQHSPDAIRRFFEANREAIDYARAHRDQWIAYGEKRLNLPAAVLGRVYDNTAPTWDDSQRIDVQGTLNAIGIVKDLGDINKSWNPTIDQIADQSLFAK